MSEGDRSKQPPIDYMRPIVADADTGYVQIRLLRSRQDLY